MPRYARLHVTGGLFHVICRFHNREFLLDYDGARERYRHCLEVALSRTDVRLFAYCLMSSHVHIVLQLGTTPLGTFTSLVNTGWVNWLNKKYRRLGTAMADRPKSVFCDTETYALDLVRYVHNNPVRAGVVRSAEESSWSSHRAYIGKEDPPEWLEIEPVLYRLSNDVEEARGKFAAFVEEGKFEPRRPEFAGEVSREMAKRIRNLIGGPVEISYPILGPDEFVLNAFGKQERENVDRLQFGRVSIGAMDVLRAVSLETGLKEGDLLGRSRRRDVARGRRLTAWIWCERLERRNVAIADLFGTKPSAVTQMLHRMREEESAGLNGDLVELILRRIRKRLIRKLEQAEKDPDLKREPKEAQVLLLQRLREIDERLFGPVSRQGTGDPDDPEGKT